MNFNIVFRLLFLIIRLLRKLSKSNNHFRITKTFIQNERFYQMSFSLWTYAIILAIILCFCWYLGSKILDEISFINDGKISSFFNSSNAILSFILLFIVSCLPVKYFKKYIIVLFIIGIISFILCFHIVGSCTVSLFHYENFSEIRFDRKRSGRGFPLISVLYYWTCFASPLAVFATLFNLIPIWFFIKKK